LFPQDMLAEAEALLNAARARGWRITTAESCTGGLIAGLLTAIGGSSDVVDGGAVTYSNAAKTRMLGVPAEMIAAQGAVSEDVARAMARAAVRQRSPWGWSGSASPHVTAQRPSGASFRAIARPSEWRPCAMRWPCCARS
jgi:nicotinamide-nucleotide amidase